MIEHFNKILASSEGTQEKIFKVNKLKEKIEIQIVQWNKDTKNNLCIKISKGSIKEIIIKHKYTDKNINKNNKKLLKIILKNLVSPEKSTKLYKKYYEEEEDKAKVTENKITTNLFKSLFKNLDLNINPIFKKEEIIKFQEENNEEEKNTKSFFVTNIFNPSYEILLYLTKNIDIIEDINITLISNQNIETRNKSTKIILPLGVGKRYNNRDYYLSPTKKSLIHKLYERDKQEYKLNITMNIKLKKELTFQQEIIFKDILKKNGIIIQKKSEEIVNSITCFDLLMLLSNIKGKKND